MAFLQLLKVSAQVPAAFSSSGHLLVSSRGYPNGKEPRFWTEQWAILFFWDRTTFSEAPLRVGPYNCFVVIHAELLVPAGACLLFSIQYFKTHSCFPTLFLLATFSLLLKALTTLPPSLTKISPRQNLSGGISHLPVTRWTILPVCPHSLLFPSLVLSSSLYLLQHDIPLINSSWSVRCSLDGPILRQQSWTSFH